MAFDVNSLGGKLIDNQELLKAIQQGGGGGGGSVTIVTLTFSRNPNDPSMWTATGDKTCEDLKPIMENGGAIALRGDFEGNGTSISKFAYGYEVYADEVILRIPGGYGEILFTANTGEQLSGSTV